MLGTLSPWHAPVTRLHASIRPTEYSTVPVHASNCLQQRNGAVTRSNPSLYLRSVHGAPCTTTIVLSLPLLCKYDHAASNKRPMLCPRAGCQGAVCPTNTPCILARDVMNRRFDDGLSLICGRHLLKTSAGVAGVSTLGTASTKWISRRFSRIHGLSEVCLLYPRFACLGSSAWVLEGRWASTAPDPCNQCVAKPLTHRHEM